MHVHGKRWVTPKWDHPHLLGPKTVGTKASEATPSRSSSCLKLNLLQTPEANSSVVTASCRRQRPTALWALPSTAKLATCELKVALPLLWTQLAGGSQPTAPSFADVAKT